MIKNVFFYNWTQLHSISFQLSSIYNLRLIDVQFTTYIDVQFTTYTFTIYKLRLIDVQFTTYTCTIYDL